MDILPKFCVQIYVDMIVYLKLNLPLYDEITCHQCDNYSSNEGACERQTQNHSICKICQNFICTSQFRSIELTCDFRDQNHCSSLCLTCGKINCRDRIEFLIEFKIYVTLPLLFPSSLSLSASLLSSPIPTQT